MKTIRGNTVDVEGLLGGTEHNEFDEAQALREEIRVLSAALDKAKQSGLPPASEICIKGERPIEVVVTISVR